MRYRHRMDPEAPLRFVYPDWLDDMMRADLARSLPGDSGGQSERLAVADAEIDSWFAVRKINTTRALDAPRLWLKSARLTRRPPSRSI